MLDRKVIKDFLEDRLEGIKIPQDIPIKILVETFCEYVEDDYYGWLKDNFKSFFEHRTRNWDWIRERIEHYSKNDSL